MESTGHVHREVPVPSLGGLPEPPMVVVRSAAEGEPVIYGALLTGLPRTPVDGPYRGSGPVVVLGDSLKAVTMIRGLESFVGTGFAGAVLFGRTTLLAGSSAGLWIGDTEHRSVTLWEEGPDPLRVVRWTSGESLALPEEAHDEFWTRVEPRLSPEERAMLDQLRSVALFADDVPAFGSLVAGPGDELWIGEFRSPEYQMFELPPPSQEWLVLKLDERTAGRIVTPEGFTVMQVGEGFVVGVHRDGLGIETVRKYRMWPVS
jgi:hypothetical protein